MKVAGKASAAALLLVALGVSVTGCSSKKVWRTSGQMCKAHGGTYSSENQRCSFAAATAVSAKQACEDQGGLYMEERQRCEFDE